MLINNKELFDPIKDKMIQRIKILKNIYGHTFDLTDHNKAIYKGSRWQNDERIFYLFCEELLKMFSKELNNKVEKDKLLNYINSLNQQEIDKLLLNAIIETAQCDYYYKFEKEW